MNFEEITIKEKANFIYENSDIIWSKLNNPLKNEETVNSLQILLLCSYTLNEDILICKDLLQSTEKNIDRKNNDNYNNSIKIIFYMASFINNNNLLKKNKEALKDKLRLYSKYFPASKEATIKNNEFIKLYEKKIK